MDEVKIISSEEDIKIFADLNRFAIMDCLATYNILTTNDISDKTGLPYSRVSYSLKKLEEAGFVEVVDTKLKFGIQEKYYSLTAKEFRIVSEDKTNTGLLDETILKSITREYLKTANYSCDNGEVEHKDTNIIIGNVYLTKDEFLIIKEKLNNYFNELLEPYKERRDEEQKPYTISNILFERI